MWCPSFVPGRVRLANNHLRAGPPWREIEDVMQNQISPMENDPDTDRKPASSSKLKTWLGPFGVVIVLILKFGAKLKFIVLPLIKFFPILLKTGGTMILSLWAYSMFWGWQFAAGFVLLILLHEFGHLVAAKVCRLDVG